MKKLLCAIASTLCLVAFVSVSQATVLWSSVASDCTLDSGTSPSKAVIDATTGAISFASGQTGTIRLSCRVTPFSLSGCGSTTYLYQTSADGDGGNTYDNYYVTAWLNSIPMGTGTSITNVAHVESQYANKNEMTQSPYITTSSINFGTNFYFVSIDIYRLSTTYNPTFWGVSLRC